jgi:colanic acid/amylovoran biosynthesis glycosyltransferase
MLARETVNTSMFPLEDLYTLSSLSRFQRFLNILFFRLFGYIPYFKNKAEGSNIRILHVHFGNHGVKSLGLKKKLGIPMVCSFYGADAFKLPVHARYKTAYGHLFEGADRILVLGKYMQAELMRLGCPEAKINIHHLGIDCEAIRFEKRDARINRSMTFLFASSFVEKKGIDTAMEAFSLLRDKYDFSIEIIGNGPLKDKIVDIITKNGIADRVKFHGYQPYEFFINLCYQCDIFVQASKTSRLNDKEGTPMSIVDAMATGMPVIATHHSDIPEIVIDSETGFLARENDVEDLKQAIEKIMNCREIDRLSFNSRQHIEREFNAKIQAGKLETIYLDLIEKH